MNTYAHVISYVATRISQLKTVTYTNHWDLTIFKHNCKIYVFSSDSTQRVDSHWVCATNTVHS